MTTTTLLLGEKSPPPKSGTRKQLPFDGAVSAEVELLPPKIEDMVAVFQSNPIQSNPKKTCSSSKVRCVRAFDDTRQKRVAKKRYSEDGRKSN
jgi:hypothetical protein